MLLCLYRHPQVTPGSSRLGVLRADDVVDVNLACVASLAGHMKLRRAQEIADALAPPDLLRFLEGGRHSWNALHDSIGRLGAALGPDLLAPEGEVVALAKTDVRLVPLVPAAAGWSSDGPGAWDAVAIPSPGSTTEVSLHTDGRAYLPEYFAVIGATTEHAGPDDALDAVALVAVVRPSRPQSAAVLHPWPAEAPPEPDLAATVAAAVAAASRDRSLFAGDVVRCGPPVVARTVDLRLDVAPAADLSDIVPSL